MTPQEQALQSWRQDRVTYEKKARKVINELCESMQMLPSSSYDAKLEELKEYLRYNYTYDEEENFLEVYVQSIAGRRNISVMELANRLVEEIGGTTKFWQKKVTDLAAYVTYHPELSVWEVNSFYERFLGLDPEAANHLRKKKALAKKYLANLSGICKLIDRSKPFEEDLVKIDELFLKLKRSEEEYFAFVEEVEDRRVGEAEGLSSKGILNAKKNLFLFLKPKEQKLNTLINYNFKCRKSTTNKPSKLMEKTEYAAFDALLEELKKQRKSQRINMSKSPRKSDKGKPITIPELRQQFYDKNKKAQKAMTQPSPQGHPVYIWSKQFFFSYCGYLIKNPSTIDYTSPFERYANVNYEIDSEEEYDEFYAEDVDLNDSDESNSLDDNQNSFVVSDCHDSDKEEEQRLKAITDHYFQDRWVKRGEELTGYTMFGFESWPLPLEEEDFCTEEMIGKASGKSRAEIVRLFEEEKKAISKMKLDHFLKNNFKKMRSKDKHTIYVRSDNDSKERTLSDNDTNDNYEISISYASRPRRTQDPDATILEQSEAKSSKEEV